METLNPSIETGPLPEETWLSTGLDMYKLTMSQFDYETNPDIIVTFSYKNRGDQRIMDYVDPAVLRERLEFIRQRGWSTSEIEALKKVPDTKGNRLFTEEFLTYLVDNPLPQPRVSYDETIDDIAVDATGDLPLASLWETIVMNEISEMYFANYLKANNIDLNELYQTGDELFAEKEEYLRNNPDVKIMEFGTRRRFSLRWHKHILERLIANCQDNLLGTSNVGLAISENVPMKGTYAHQEPMVWAGIARALGKDVKESQGAMADAWTERYPDLFIPLPDTFRTESFLQILNAERAKRVIAIRQDSGDPIAFGEKIIDHYQQLNLATPPIVFSNDLKIGRINTLDPIHRYFDGRFPRSYGIGTNLTNDLDPQTIQPLNQVMKATSVQLPNGLSAPLAKISDDPLKHNGKNETVDWYDRRFNPELVSVR